MTHRFGVLCAVFLVAGCSSDPSKNDAEFQRQLVTQLQHDVLAEIQGFHRGAVDLQAAAPSPSGRGWNDSDEPALTMMKDDWTRVRASWERSEGVLSALFPDLDLSMDSRYEDFLTPDQLGQCGDPDQFDGSGVTGMHAIERILFLLDTPASVIARESTLPGYQAARWPATEQEAAEFKTGLAARLVSDSQTLVDRWVPDAVDLPRAFTGLTALINEQAEKVNLGGLQLDESRYSQRTMRDIRDNLAGTRTFYARFSPWLVTKPGGPAIDLSVQQALNRLELTYDNVAGEALPQPPPDWNSDLPSIADQGTDFGKLYLAVIDEVTPGRPGSAVDEMNRAALALGLPQFASTD